MLRRMSRFLLQPAKIRGDRMVPTKEPAVELDFKALQKLLAPSGSPQARRTLLQLRPGSWIGLRSGSVPPSNFLLQNQDYSGEIGWLLAQDPLFPETVRSLYRVDIVEYDGGVRDLS